MFDEIVLALLEGFHKGSKALQKVEVDEIRFDRKSSRIVFFCPVERYEAADEIISGIVRKINDRLVKLQKKAKVEADLVVLEVSSIIDHSAQYQTVWPLALVMDQLTDQITGLERARAIVGSMIGQVEISPVQRAATLSAKLKHTLDTLTVEKAAQIASDLVMAGDEYRRTSKATDMAKIEATVNVLNSFASMSGSLLTFEADFKDDGHIALVVKDVRPYKILIS